MFSEVTPKETFILPKQSAMLEIKMFPDKCDKEKKCKENIFLCKVLGFLRIAPSDKLRER